MNLYHVHVALNDQYPDTKTEVYADTACEAIAGALRFYPAAQAIAVRCDLYLRDVKEIRDCVDVLHADCFPP